ncbi:MAG TPA: MCE family protein [Jatrophihabitans sp.]|nr:MCE family protein [Jatrophihabitans sp.]
MKSFNERNPVTIAVVGMLAIAVIALGTFYWNHLPLVGNSTGYVADFAEAGGLQSGDDVRVAGVKVGTVSDVSLEGTHVRVDFDVAGTWIGDRSTAAIGIKTLLGRKYLAVDPLGDHALPAGATIPLARTTALYDVTTALEGLGSQLGHIDTAQLGRSFEAIAGAFRNTPASVRASLRGLTALSRTIASRDDELALLVRNTRRITDVLAADNPQIDALLRDGNLLLSELQRRSAAVTALFNGTQQLSRQLTGLVADNNATLAPALTQLNRVTTLLENNQANLDNALRLIGPYYSLLNDAVGTGPWLDTYICGLFTLRGVPQLNSTAQRNCAPQAPPGAGR